MSEQQDLAFNRSMARAQAAYDAQMPPTDTVDDDGKCLHRWKHHRNGWATCLRCGEVIEGDDPEDDIPYPNPYNDP